MGARPPRGLPALLCVTALAVLARAGRSAAGRACFAPGPRGGAAAPAARAGVVRRAAEPREAEVSEAQRRALRLPTAEQRAERAGKWEARQRMEDMYEDTGSYDKLDPWSQGVYVVGACGVAVIWLPVVARLLDSLGLYRLS